MIQSPTHLARRAFGFLRRLWLAEHIDITIQVWIFTLYEIPIMAFAWVHVVPGKRPL